MKKEKYWIRFPKKRSTSEWCDMPVDWKNESKLSAVESYLFRYDGLKKGLSNEVILRSIFGRKAIGEIEKELIWWYDRCVGVYSEIEYI